MGLCRILVLGAAMKHILILVLSFIALSACADTGVELSKEVRGNETFYLAAGSSCKLIWLVRYYKEGFSVRQDGSHCIRPAAERQAYWDALLKNVMSDTNNLQGMLGFQWGPLQQAENDTELSLRLMQAAAHAKEWDGKRGVLRKHPRDVPNLFVEKLLKQAKVFVELTETFGKHGMQLEVGDVEEVLIKQTTVDGVGKVTVPYNCLVSFSVKKLPTK